jgi:hypothetical protein
MMLDRPVDQHACRVVDLVPAVGSRLGHDETFEWLPARHGVDYERYAEPFKEGIIAWDGLLLAGWRSI